MSTTVPATVPPAAPAADRWPVRVWPGLLILAAVPLLMLAGRQFAERTMFHFLGWFLGPLLGAVAAVGWWVFAARVRGPLRLLAPVLLFVPAVVVGATAYWAAPLAVLLVALPLVLALWIGWVALSVLLPGRARRAGLVVLMAAGWGAVALTRPDGTDGNLVPAIRWRWEPTAEEQFLAERGTVAPAAATRSVVVGPGDWAEFRGPARDGRLAGVTIDPDWEKHPPQLVWKHRVGPGWGTFAVAGGLLFTQEQRGPDEAVVCYDAESGAEVWEHKYPARFTEAIAGAGPRATPTVHDGRVYAQGATGKLVCLEVATGKLVWSTDLTAAVNGKVPDWGYASSPLVIDGVVVVYAGGPDGKGTAAFRADSGALAWAGGRASHGYSSAQRATFGGAEQVLMVSDFGLESFDPATGKLLWSHDWHVKGMNRVNQPAVVSDTDVVMTSGVGSDQGVRRLRVTKAGDGWDVKTVWSTRGMSPYFNDNVTHAGHLFGFDGNRFCCVDLETGKRKWKDGDYGHGQVLLLADQGLLVVVTERGDVALVEANPAEWVELARLPAVKGKTWNHPVVAHGKLYVRNGEEAACFRLAGK